MGRDIFRWLAAGGAWAEFAVEEFRPAVRETHHPDAFTWPKLQGVILGARAALDPGTTGLPEWTCAMKWLQAVELTSGTRPLANMKPRRAPISSPFVAITFVVAFTCLTLFSSQWYDPAVMWNDPTMAFLWAGSCYVVAYSLAEFVRWVTWPTLIGLLGGGTLLAFDVARHGNLLLQDASGGVSTMLLPLISSSYCAVTGDSNLPCKLTVFLATSPATVFAVVAAALLTSAVGKFLSLRSSAPPSAAAEH